MKVQLLNDIIHRTDNLKTRIHLFFLAHEIGIFDEISDDNQAKMISDTISIQKDLGKRIELFEIALNRGLLNKVMEYQSNDKKNRN